MNAFLKELELISLVNNNYEYIQQLETLSNHYSRMVVSDYDKQYPSEYGLTQEQIDNLVIITKTTQNSHYGMKLFTSEEFQNESNIVDNVLIKLDKKPLRSFKQEYFKLKIKS